MKFVSKNKGLHFMDPDFDEDYDVDDDYDAYLDACDARYDDRD